MLRGMQENPEWGDWKIDGLGLSKTALEDVYAGNAERLLRLRL